MDAGVVNNLITITGTGTTFIPGTTACVEISNNFAVFTVTGSATSSTEYNGFVTIPIFASTGPYDLTIYQGPGCSGPSWSCEDCVSICAPKNILGAPVPATCFGCTDGAVNLNVFGGTPPYNFNWSNGANTQSLANIGAGQYDVTITDAAGCPSFESYTVTQPEPLTVLPTHGNQGSTVGMVLFGAQTNFIPGVTTCVEVTNGNQTYSFSGESFDNTNFSGDWPIPPNAPPGQYDVSLYQGPGCSGDAWGCTNCFTICIPMNVNGIVSDATCTGCPNGSIDLTVTGGTPPYDFAWSNGSSFEDPTVLIVGSYSVTVTDLAGCTEIASFSVDEPDPISITPENANPGTTANFAIIGAGTDFVPGMTTCVEFNLGNEVYQITGSASSNFVFNGSFVIPFDATPGDYDVTIYRGFNCEGTAWTCNDCFTVLNPFICGGNYYDIGGPLGDYPNSTNLTQTICPDVPGNVVTITFNTFSMENNGTNCYDQLLVYDGPDEFSPVIPSPGGATVGWCWDRDDPIPNGSGDLQGMQISAKDISGCLTFAFYADGANTREGWNASIECSPRLEVMQPTADPGTTVTSTINGVGTTFTPGITTCAEFSKDGFVFTAFGDAADETNFDFSLDLPINAPSGLYDVTVFAGPGCGPGFQSNSWTCTDCFQVLGTNFPVEFIYFQAEAKKTEVLVTWATATEINSSHYEVQKSKNGIDWDLLEIVYAAGNSTDVIYYSATDRSPFSGTSYYRLKQVDLDDTYTYSPVEAVKIEVHEGLVEVHPNPANHDASVMIVSDGIEHATIVITSLTGKIMDEIVVELQPGVNSIDLDIKEWMNGMYFIEIKGFQTWNSARLIKI